MYNLQYQSLYNFRIQNLPKPNDPFVLPLDSIGQCNVDSLGVCTDHANFAEYMYRMGKTLSAFPTPTEQEIIKYKPQSAAKARVTRNPVMVLEMSQLQDSHNKSRTARLRNDLMAFIGLDIDSHDADQLLPAEPPHYTPGKKWDKEIQATRDQRKINICDASNDKLRQELMQMSRLASVWIRESFLPAKDVFVSSPEFFHEAMMKWMDDPCDSVVAKKK